MRAAWVTAPSGKSERVWTCLPDVDIDVSDLVSASPPATSRAVTRPFEEAALADLLQRSRSR